MDPLSAYDIAKLRILERQEQAAQERLLKVARPSRASSDDEIESGVWHRWLLRRLSGRITLARAGATA
jgi:hypothetical protein